MDGETGMRMSAVALGLTIGVALSCSAAELSSGTPLGACYVYSGERALRYCRENVVETTCYEAARNFKMTGKWSKDEKCADADPN
jgi:hypothetical protein